MEEEEPTATLVLSSTTFTNGLTFPMVHAPASLFVPMSAFRTASHISFILPHPPVPISYGITTPHIHYPDDDASAASAICGMNPPLHIAIDIDGFTSAARPAIFAQEYARDHASPHSAGTHALVQGCACHSQLLGLYACYAQDESQVLHLGCSGDMKFVGILFKYTQLICG